MTTNVVIMGNGLQYTRSSPYVKYLKNVVNMETIHHLFIDFKAVYDSKDRRSLYATMDCSSQGYDEQYSLLI